VLIPDIERLSLKAPPVVFTLGCLAACALPFLCVCPPLGTPGNKSEIFCGRLCPLREGERRCIHLTVNAQPRGPTATRPQGPWPPALGFTARSPERWGTWVRYENRRQGDTMDLTLWKKRSESTGRPAGRRKARQTTKPLLEEGYAGRRSESYIFVTLTLWPLSNYGQQGQ